MASMQRSHGQYYAVYRDRQRKRQIWYPLGRNLRAARRLFCDIEDMLETGRDPLLEKTTFADAWAERMKVAEISPSQRPKMVSLYKTHLKKYFNGVEIATVNSKRAITAFKSHLIDLDTRPGTIRQVLIALKAFLNWCWESDYLRSEPKATWFEIPRGRERKLRPLTFAQVEALASAQKTTERSMFVLWSAYAGTRLGETRALDWQDLNSDKSEVWVRRAWKGKCLADYTKDGSDRHTRIRPVLRGRLDEYWVARGKPTTGFVFAYPDGRPLDGDILREQYDRAKRTVGLGDYTIHDLRHTACSLAHQAGSTPAEIMRDFGWADLQMLKRYLHPYDRGADEVDSKMQRQWEQEMSAASEADHEAPVSTSDDGDAS